MMVISNQNILLHYQVGSGSLEGRAEEGDLVLVMYMVLELMEIHN
jgi:hypothetical protein